MTHFQTLTHAIPGLILTDHWFEVPLDYNQPGGETLRVFARELVAPDKKNADLPWLAFFQGGPGFESPRPDGAFGWIKRAVQDYRVLLLDQRGTGLSTPILPQTLRRLPSPQAQADYLKHFRADAIVQDAEYIRQQLLGEESWSILGQSYGGFCALTYLSFAPDGLNEVFITGGIPSIERPVDDLYRATYQRLISRNRAYYARYPEDVERVNQIVEYLMENEVVLPSGGFLTARRFQQSGMSFGMEGGFERVHYQVENAYIQWAHGPELGYPFLNSLDQWHAFDTNPIYALLHEPLYCQGQASLWSAARLRAEFPEFEIHPEQPVYFTGEMIYPWMFEDYANLRPLKESADLLAEFAGWPPLYDPAALEHNRVPVAAVVYYDDPYVERQFSEETASRVPGMRLWVTNEHEHSALRMHSDEVLSRLFGMLHGEI